MQSILWWLSPRRIWSSWHPQLYIFALAPPFPPSPHSNLTFQDQQHPISNTPTLDLEHPSITATFCIDTMSGQAPLRKQLAFLPSEIKHRFTGYRPRVPRQQRSYPTPASQSRGNYHEDSEGDDDLSNVETAPPHPHVETAAPHPLTSIPIAASKKAIRKSHEIMPWYSLADWTGTDNHTDCSKNASTTAADTNMTGGPLIGVPYKIFQLHCQPEYKNHTMVSHLICLGESLLDCLKGDCHRWSIWRTTCGRPRSGKWMSTLEGRFVVVQLW